MSGVESTPLRLLVFAETGVDLAALVRDVYNNGMDAEYGSRIDDESVAQVITVAWSGVVCDDPPRVAWRVEVEFAEVDEEYQEQEDALARYVAENVVALARDSESGIVGVIKLADPTQLKDYTELYKELYLMEMSLREVVSYIFACEYPNNLVDGLSKTKVKTASRQENMPPDDQLIKYGENRFFYILFDKYAVLNDVPDVKAAQISDAIKNADDLQAVQNALDLRPVKLDRHAAFLASLQVIMDPLEKTRNSVCHTRTVPEKVLQDYHIAVKKLREEIDAFWQREAEETESVTINDEGNGDGGEGMTKAGAGHAKEDP